MVSVKPDKSDPSFYVYGSDRTTLSPLKDPNQEPTSAQKGIDGFALQDTQIPFPSQSLENKNQDLPPDSVHGNSPLSKLSLQRWGNEQAPLKMAVAQMEVKAGESRTQCRHHVAPDRRSQGQGLRHDFLPRNVHRGATWWAMLGTTTTSAKI